MSLGTLDRTPPPFFKQGPSALTRLLFFASMAVFLMVADTRFQITRPVRSVLATVLHPVEQALLAPSRWWADAGWYFQGMDEARQAREKADALLTQQAARTMRLTQLETENARLRELLTLRPRIEVHSQVAEVLYDTRDPFTRRIVVDRGSTHRVELGSPVIDQAGVVGQVTRVYPLTSEVTLLTDRDAAVPVVNERTRQHGLAYGVPQSGGMELRFMAANADVQAGDRLSTSGLDGVYPAGLPVARVAAVDRRSDSAFARITLQTEAAADAPGHVLLLAPVGAQLPARPEPAPVAAAAKGVSTSRASSVPPAGASGVAAPASSPAVTGGARP